LLSQTPSFPVVKKKEKGGMGDLNSRLEKKGKREKKRTMTAV